MKCLVSGATGFIGRQLCHQLQQRGDTVVALSRGGASLPGGMPTQAVDLARGSPDPASFDGVEVVFHLAGIAHQRAAGSDYRRLNEEATLRLARLARDAGATCFIFLSSVKAMGPPNTAGPRAEPDCSTPADAYGRSKLGAECALREEFAGGPMGVVILRPALVYGAGARGNLQRLITAVRRGMPRPPEGGRRSMIAVEDLVALMCEIADSPPPGVHTWIACSHESYSTRDVYDLLRAAGGRGVGRAWLPRGAWRLAALLADSAAGQRRGSTFDKMFGEETYDNAALLEARAWRPGVTLEQVIGRMAVAERKS